MKDIQNAWKKALAYRALQIAVQSPPDAAVPKKCSRNRNAAHDLVLPIQERPWTYRGADCVFPCVAEQEGNHGGFSACASETHPRANRGADVEFPVPPVPLERVHEQIVDRMVVFPVPHIVEMMIVEDLMEMDQIISQERISKRSVEQSVDVLTPEMLEQIVAVLMPHVAVPQIWCGRLEAIWPVHQERSHQRIVGQSVLLPVPQVLEDLVEMDQTISERHIEQSVDVSVPDRLEEIV